MAKTILFQHNTLASLMAGIYEGTMSVEELLKHGNFGVGTVDSVDGELIVLDGKVYQATGTNDEFKVKEVPSHVLVPYAAVVHHTTTKSWKEDNPIDSENLKKTIEEKLDSHNLFYSVKIKGTFSKMHVRMIPKSKTGERFAEVAKNQPEFTQENISGTLIGIWTPELFHGVSVAGFHLHFLADDLHFGGHVMDFVMQDGNIEIGRIDQLEQNFPVDNKTFLEKSFDVLALRSDIEASE
ncbi:acetolactate decarboxylase [Streptococcus pacificus]|uniref:Alpha-acetolactate decarboxylase n=1 Tax=Streptococcus pacificus TaxID=2740577 RepID=A0ABS0ZH17_9STRE|nr:acetolactate decarboxylase [Streptococcus pacificus]MBJ8325296.1 acetolactate decarboxylase [Streptococcus pacificus]